MKKLLKFKTQLIAFVYAMLVAVFFVGCTNSSPKSLKGIGEVNVIEVDSCEYVVYQGSSQGGIVHHQNCKYCLARTAR